MTDETIITIKDYGRINICLKQLMDEKKMTRYSLSKATGTRFEVINKWYDGNIERLDLDVLARVCYVLGCEPSDIIKYDKNNENALIEIEAKIENEN